MCLIDLESARVTCFLVCLDLILDAVPSSLTKSLCIEPNVVFQLTMIVIRLVFADFSFPSFSIIVITQGFSFFLISFSIVV